MAGLWLALSVFAWFKPADAASDAERRPLEQFPQITAQSVLSGEFSKDFGKYAVDQFPLRDSWRRVNAVLNYYGFQKKDNNGIYLHGGAAAKMEYPLKEDMVDYAAARFNDLYRMYLEDTGCTIRYAVAPDLLMPLRMQSADPWSSSPRSRPSRCCPGNFPRISANTPWISSPCGTVGAG